VPSIGQDNTLVSPVVDDFGQVWCAAPKDRGIVVIKPGVLEIPTDDLSRLVDDKAGNGGLPSRTVICLLKDENGLIWAGTEKGLSIFYSPGSVFTGNNFDSQRLIYGKGNSAYYLFDNERINCMALDPANRKWIGTPNGLWLLSADGNELLANFTRDNSPLLSNDIVAITVDPESGEVFVATDQGLLSLKGDAIVGLETKGDIEVFPNPVLSSYTGPIAIKNLVKDAYVKITDINGNLVFETRSNGGLATWYGQRFDGQRVSTGVYLIFASYEDGTESSVGKVLVFH
jgi:hypothetical protein